MPTQADIVLNDGQATPVAHTFNPQNEVDGVFYSYDHSPGTPIGYLALSQQLRMPQRGNKQATGVYRVKASVRVPVLETLGTSDSGLTPPPTKAYELVWNNEFIIPERCSEANRKDILAFAQNYLADAIATSLVVDLKALY